MTKEYFGRLRSRPMLIIALGLLIFLLIRSLTLGDLIKKHTFEDSIEDGEKVAVSGYIISQEQKDDKTILILDSSNILYNSKKYSAGKILFYTSDNRFYSIGSQIKGQGKLKLLRIASNPGQFDEYTYYKSLSINARITGEVDEVDNTKASSYRTYLARLRRNISDVIDKTSLSSNEAGVVKAMLLGEKTELDEEEKQVYKNAGIIHLISISGLHITIIGLGLYKLLRKRGLSFLLCGVCASAVMASFVIMTGASVSSQRALIMFIILLGANILGRSQDPLNSISIAAIILMLSNSAIIYNPSFVLTFTAVIGVNTLSFAVKGLVDLYEGPLKRSISAFLFGLSLWIFTFPVILYFYYEAPTYSILVNLIVIPFAPLILIGSLIGGTVGLIPGVLPSSISRVIFLLPKGILMANDAISRFVNQLPYAVKVYGQPDIWTVVAYYMILIIIMISLRRYTKRLANKRRQENRGKNKAKTDNWSIKQFLKSIIESLIVLKKYIAENTLGIRQLIIRNSLLCILAFCLVTFHPRLNTRVSLIDVGQGDCILIQCRSGENILVDGGSSSVSKVGTYRILPCLKSLGISKLDRIILTHPDNDHINGISDVLTSNLEVGEINIASVYAKSEKLLEIFDNSIRLNSQGQICRIADTKVNYLMKGDCFEYGETSFEVLHPESSGNLTDNEASIVLLVKENKIKGLLTGDLEGRGEENLIRELKGINIEFLKVAHHGSKNSSSEEFLEAVKPIVALISSGKNNRYGHPHGETIDRLNKVKARILNTAEAGYIELKLNYDYINTHCKSG